MNYDDLLRVLARQDDVEFMFRVNKEFTDVRVLVNCSDLFHWACADAEELTAADLDDLDQAYNDLKALGGHDYVYADALWVCRKRGMRPQGPWYGYMDAADMVRRTFAPRAQEALFDACGPEREDSPKAPRPADGRRWDRGGSKTPEDNPPEFIAMFQPGGEFGP